MDPSTISGGLLTGSDYLSLAAGLYVEHRSLCDTANGARHTLHPKAVFLVRRLQAGLPYQEWLKLAKRRKLRPREAGQILLFLNSIGGLQIERGWRARVGATSFRLRLLAAGLRPPDAVRRWPLSLGAVLRGVAHASKVFMVLAPLTVFLLYAMGLDGLSAVGYTVIFCVAFWASVVLHEATHMILVTDTGAMVLQKGMRIGILHKPLAGHQEVASAVSGPLVGAGLALALCVVASKITSLRHLQAAGLVLAGAHLWSLAPWYGDGATIWTNKRSIKGGLPWQHLNEATDNKSSLPH